MNKNEYDLISKLNKQYDEAHKYDKLIQYLKNNHLAIIDLFLSTIAIIISIIALIKTV